MSLYLNIWNIWDILNMPIQYRNRKYLTSYLIDTSDIRYFIVSLPKEIEVYK